jgi:hypothetical protein
MDFTVVPKVTKKMYLTGLATLVAATLIAAFGLNQLSSTESSSVLGAHERNHHRGLYFG